MSRLVWVEIPMQLPSEANAREHWRARSRRAKLQRVAVTTALRSHNLRQGLLEAMAVIARGEQLSVTLTRVSPRKLDSDNLAISAKHVRDSVAAFIGCDDGSDQWDWRYAQERGPVAVRIDIGNVFRLAALPLPVRPGDEPRPTAPGRPERRSEAARGLLDASKSSRKVAT